MPTILHHIFKSGVPRDWPVSGQSRSARRTVSELSFHSLRHNITSWLKWAGGPESVVRDIIGHESELVSRDCTHMDDETKRKVIRKLPTLV